MNNKTTRLLSSSFPLPGLRRLLPVLITAAAASLAHGAGVMPGTLPVAGYKFDEGSGGTTADAFGSITGTLAGPAAFSSTVPIPYAGNFALDLTAGGNDFVDLGNQANLFFPGAFSLSLWARPSEVVTNPFGHYLVADYSSSADMSSFALRLNGTAAGANAGRAGFFWENPPASTPGFITSVTDIDSSINNWYHIVTVYDGAGTSRIYINGVLENSLSFVQARTDIGGNTAIGRAGSFDAPNFNFNGLVDDVAFFDYALTDDNALWLSTNSLNAIPEPASSGLLLAGLGLAARRRRA
jgi:hypothetical protein